jgi:hypothetical protein
MSPSESYDAATPSLPESAALGLMHKDIHKKGLQSGGLLGYQTFFSGYNPERGDGAARRLSIGRLAGQGVSMAARGLKQAGLAGTAAEEFLDRASMFHKHGLGAFVDPSEEIRSGAGRQARQNMLGKAKFLSQNGSAEYSTPGKNPGRRRAALEFAEGGFGTGSIKSGPKLQPAPDVDPSDVNISGSAAREIREKGRKAAFKAAADDSWLYKIMGALGARGYSDDGTKAAVEGVEETVDGKDYRMVAAAGDKGPNLISGRLGSYAGKALRMYGYYEVAKMAVDATTYAAGQAYESMVSSTEEMMRRVGRSETMSRGYYNRAAATERQRAVQELNDSTLNPRTQLMGNEATMMS